MKVGRTGHRCRRVVYPYSCCDAKRRSRVRARGGSDGIHHSPCCHFRSGDNRPRLSALDTIPVIPRTAVLAMVDNARRAACERDIACGDIERRCLDCAPRESGCAVSWCLRSVQPIGVQALLAREDVDTNGPDRGSLPNQGDGETRSEAQITAQATTWPAIAKKHRSLRVPGPRWFIGLSLFALVAAAVICASAFLFVHVLIYGRHVSTDDLPGTYRANYFDSSDVLVLRDDGTFNETFTYHDGTSYQNAGYWRVETRHGRLDVLLDNAFVWGSGGKPPLLAWRLHAYRGLLGSMVLKWGDPDGIVQFADDSIDGE
jgi:hypothetical protein